MNLMMHYRKRDRMTGILCVALELAAVIAIVNLVVGMAQLSEQAPQVALALFPQDTAIARAGTNGAPLNLATNVDEATAAPADAGFSNAVSQPAAIPAASRETPSRKRPA